MVNVLRAIIQRFTTSINITEPLKMALVVRGDLKLTKGKTAAQCAHASVICYERSVKQKPQILQNWLNLGQPKIVLRVDSLTEMEEILENAKRMKVVSGLVRDAGRTQVEAGTITVLGLGPDSVSNIDALVKHLKLL